MQKFFNSVKSFPLNVAQMNVSTVEEKKKPKPEIVTVVQLKIWRVILLTPTEDVKKPPGREVNSDT